MGASKNYLSEAMVATCAKSSIHYYKFENEKKDIDLGNFFNFERAIHYCYELQLLKNNNKRKEKKK